MEIWQGSYLIKFIWTKVERLKPSDKLQVYDVGGHEKATFATVKSIPKAHVSPSLFIN